MLATTAPTAHAQVLGERKMAMAAGNLKESEDEALLLLWADRQWTWLDEVGRNELLVLSTEEVRCSSPPVPIRPSSLRTPLGVAPRSPYRRPRHTHAPVLALPCRRSRR